MLPCGQGTVMSGEESHSWIKTVSESMNRLGFRRPCPVLGPGHVTGVRMAHGSSWKKLLGPHPARIWANPAVEPGDTPFLLPPHPTIFKNQCSVSQMHLKPISLSPQFYWDIVDIQPCISLRVYSMVTSITYIVK